MAAPGSPAVDWETSKENVAPVKRGRTVAQLGAVLAASGEDAAVLAQQREFDARIAAAPTPAITGRRSAADDWRRRDASSTAI